jgi:hypothetical protein
MYLMLVTCQVISRIFRTFPAFVIFFAAPFR